LILSIRAPLKNSSFIISSRSFTTLSYLIAIWLAITSIFRSPLFTTISIYFLNLSASFLPLITRRTVSAPPTRYECEATQ
jgi:hypothetical protein